MFFLKYILFVLIIIFFHKGGNELGVAFVLLLNTYADKEIDMLAYSF